MKPYIRWEENRPVLMIVHNDGIIERHDLKPTDLMSLAWEANRIMWAYYDLKDKE